MMGGQGTWLPHLLSALDNCLRDGPSYETDIDSTPPSSSRVYRGRMLLVLWLQVSLLLLQSMHSRAQRHQILEVFRPFRA